MGDKQFQKNKLIIGEAEQSIPDMIEKVTAYRVFNFTANNLVAPVQNTIWHNTMTAACSKVCVAPEQDCTCGLYGFHKLEYFEKDRYYSYMPLVTVSQHWGKTIVHEDGLRSQYSEVKALSFVDMSMYLNVKKLILFSLVVCLFIFLSFVFHAEILPKISASIAFFSLIPTFVAIEKIQYRAGHCPSVSVMKQYCITSVGFFIVLHSKLVLQ